MCSGRLAPTSSVVNGRRKSLGGDFDRFIEVIRQIDAFVTVVRLPDRRP
jgi:hypothetical protein